MLAGALAGFSSASGLCETANPGDATDPVASAGSDAEVGAEIEPEVGVRVFTIGFYTDFRPETALDLVFRTPGYELDSGDNVRGLAGSEGNLLINGVRPPPRGSSIYTRLSAIRLDDIVRIELLEAGARDLDMQGYPVLLNVVTATTRSRRVDARMGARLADDGSSSRHFRLGGSMQRPGLDLQATLSSNVSENRQLGQFMTATPSSLQPRLGSDAWSGFAQRGLEGAATVAFGPQTSLILSTNLTEFTFETRIDAEGGDTAGTTSVGWSNLHNNTSRQASAELRTGLSDRLDLRFVASGRSGDSSSASRLESGGVVNSNGSLTETGEIASRTSARWRPVDSLAIEGGVTWAFNFLEGGSSATLDGIAQIIPGSQARVEETRTAALLSLDWTPHERLAISLGGRVEQFSLDSSNAPDQTLSLSEALPRATVSYTMNAGWIWRWRTEREVAQLYLGRFLAATDLTTEISTSGAATLEPERKWVNELSLERRFGEAGLFRLKFSEERIENPVAAVPLADGSIRPVNIGPETVRELTGRLEWPLDEIGLAGAVLEVEVGAGQSERVDPLTGQWRPVSGHADHEWEIQFRHEIENTNFIWTLSLSDDSPRQDYWLTQLREHDEDPEGRLRIEWRPPGNWIGGVSFGSPEYSRDTITVFDQVRATGIRPTLVNTIERREDMSVSAWVEWEMRDEVKLSLSAGTGQSRDSRSRVSADTGAGLFEARRDYEAAPWVSFNLRVAR